MLVKRILVIQTHSSFMDFVTFSTLCWLGKVEIPLPIVFRMAVQVSSGLCIPQFWLGDPLKWFGEVPKSLLR